MGGPPVVLGVVLNQRDLAHGAHLRSHNHAVHAWTGVIRLAVNRRVVGSSPTRGATGKPCLGGAFPFVGGAARQARGIKDATTGVVPNVSAAATSRRTRPAPGGTRAGQARAIAAASSAAGPPVATAMHGAGWTPGARCPSRARLAPRPLVQSGGCAWRVCARATLDHASAAAWASVDSPGGVSRRSWAR